MLISDGYVTTEEGVRLFFQQVGEGERTVFIPNGIYMVQDFKVLGDGHSLIFYDVRNRGRSDAITDGAKLERGILNDVDDLEALRKHFGVEQMDLIGHSYVGLTVALYAMKHPDRVNRIVQIGPAQPDAAKNYPPGLMCMDATAGEVFGRLGQMQKEGLTGTPGEICRKFWAVMGKLLVIDPADAGRIDWGRCDCPNEAGFMRYWMGVLQPSIAKLRFEAEEMAVVKTPVLVVHGRKDRNAPYGGGVDWAGLWGNGRLLTVDNAAHAPWVEEPEMVLGEIGRFLE